MRNNFELLDTSYHDFCIVADNMNIANYEFTYTLKYINQADEIGTIKHIDFARKIIDFDYFKVYFISYSILPNWRLGRHNIQYIDALQYERDLDKKFEELKHEKI